MIYNIILLLTLLVTIFFIVFLIKYVKTKKNRYLEYIAIIGTFLALLTLFHDFFSTNTHPNAEKTTLEITESDVTDYALMIKTSFMTGNYERTIELAEEYDLCETENILNAIGVMYANGFLYEENLETAIKYFSAAIEYGSNAESYTNLLLCSYLYDTNYLENNPHTPLPYKQTLAAFRLGKKHCNKELNNILILAAASINGDIIDDGYSYLDNMTTSEAHAFLDNFVTHMSYYRYIVCTEYKYYSVDNKTVARAYRIEDRGIPLYLYRFGMPSSYCVFSDYYIPSKMINEAVTLETFEYLPHYYDSSGNLHLWEDTGNYYSGATPPEDTENSRWIIASYDATNSSTRRYQEQIKLYD